MRISHALVLAVSLAAGCGGTGSDKPSADWSGGGESSSSTTPSDPFGGEEADADGTAIDTGEGEVDDGFTDAEEEVSGTVHEVSTSDSNNDFTPQDLVIDVGDTVRFVMTSTHNAIEVNQDTYDARGITPIEGGFQVGFGETQDVTFTEVGTHYYVCTPHVTMGMIGTISAE